MSRFAVQAGVVLLALCPSLTLAVDAPARPGFLGPLTLLASPDGSCLYIAQTDAHRIDRFDIKAGKATASAALAATPTGMVLDKSGGLLYVTCAGPQGSVCVVETAGMKVAKTWAVGNTPLGPSLSPDGARLYVCNRFDNNVMAVEVASGKVLGKAAAVREPYVSLVSSDSKTVFVLNHLTNDRADTFDTAARVTVVDATSMATSTIRLINGSTGIRGGCLTPDGKWLLVTHILARYQMPTTQLERGWMNTNALSIINTAEKKLLNTILLDDVDLGAANPWSVACSVDGRTVCITHAGTHELSVLNLPGVLEKIEKTPVAAKSPEKNAPYASMTRAEIPNDLAFLVDLRRRVPLEGNGARGLAVIGNKAYVSMYFTDSLSVVDLDPAARGKIVSGVALGPAPQLTAQRKGEMLFNDAALCFQHWQSCATCHPDARVDALNWDLMNDGLGNPKNNKSMLLTHKTPPAMWTGVRPTAESAVRSGITHIQFAVRPDEDAVAIDEYLKVLEPAPSPYLVQGKLSPAAERGKALFLSDKVGCVKCHPAPLYTDLEMHDVASEGPYDRRSTFDTPSLVECWRSAPYLHDGRYVTIKELLSEGKHGNTHGQLDGLTPAQLADLAEFVLSL